MIELTICTMFIFQMGRTPLRAACGRGHSATAQLLIEKGADLNKQDYVCMTFNSEQHVNMIMYNIG